MATSKWCTRNTPIVYTVASNDEHINERMNYLMNTQKYSILRLTIQIDYFQQALVVSKEALRQGPSDSCNVKSMFD